MTSITPEKIPCESVQIPSHKTFLYLEEITESPIKGEVKAPLLLPESIEDYFTEKYRD